MLEGVSESAELILQHQAGRQGFFQAAHHHVPPFHVINPHAAGWTWGMQQAVVLCGSDIPALQERRIQLSTQG